MVTVLAGRPYTQSYHYTPAGLLDTLQASGLASDSFVTRTYTYDTRKGQLSTIGLRSQSTVLDYDANSNVTRISYPFTGVDSTTRGGLTAANKQMPEAANKTKLERWMGYNAVGQVDRHLKHLQKVGRWFAYDSLGQLRLARDRQRDPDGIPGNCPNYDYGMSGACTPDTAYTTLNSTTYLYGATGNRLDLSASYDTTHTRIAFFNGCNYATDAEGNTTSRFTGSGTCPSSIDSLVWNAEGQLTRLVLPGGVAVNYYYDAAGRVVRKDSAGVARAYFLWSGDHLLAELNSAATTKAAEYAYYPGLDNPQALIIGQTMYRARRNGLGNVVALTDSAGAIKSEYSYDDWGLAGFGFDSAGFNHRDRVRWKGALWMGPEVDLYFMRNRWYEPATGRFLSEDPLGLAGGMDRFAFAGNDPVNGSDPWGLCPDPKNPECPPPVILPDAGTTADPWRWLWGNRLARWFINSWYWDNVSDRIRSGGGVGGQFAQSGGKAEGAAAPGEAPKGRLEALAFLHQGEWKGCSMYSIEASGPMVALNGRSLGKGFFSGTLTGVFAPYRLFGIRVADGVGLYQGLYVGPTFSSPNAPVRREAKAEILCASGYGFLRAFAAP